MKEERWLPVVGYEGLYEISSLGRLKSTKRFKRGRNGSNVPVREKIINPFYKTNSKYLRVSLCKNGKHKKYFVHRLVAIAFIPNPLNLPFVNHKNENPEDNCVDNLEWCTHKYNCNYGTAIKRRSEKQMNTMSTMKKILCVDTGIYYKSIKEAARKTGIWSTNISACCRGKHKTAGGFHWKYEEE